MNFVAGTDPASVTRDIDGQKEVNLTYLSGAKSQGWMEPDDMKGE